MRSFLARRLVLNAVLFELIKASDVSILKFEGIWTGMCLYFFNIESVIHVISILCFVKKNLMVVEESSYPILVRSKILDSLS